MAVTTTSNLSNQVKVGYDLVADFALRTTMIFDQFTTMKSADTNDGSSISFTRWTEMSSNEGSISEASDVSPVTLASTEFTVTPAEYGAVTVTTAKFRSDTLLPNFQADQVNLVAYNMATSLDTICRTVMEASTEIRFVGQASEGAITATDILTADEVRQEHAAIESDNVLPFGQDYVWVIHPHVSYDLKSETGDGAWIAPTQYVNTDRVYNNELGKFAGFKFISSTRAQLNGNGGSGNVDSYYNYVFGQENTAKAVFIAPKLVQGPVIDYLLRLVPLGWYGYLGWDTFRKEASRNVLCASSMGDNS